MFGKRWAVIGLACTLLLAGCGTVNNVVTSCSAGALTTETAGAPNFTLSLVNPNLTIYPGQTEQVPVMVNPVGNATGTVYVGAVSNLQGLTITGGTAAIGSVANLTPTASSNVVSSCFVGTQYVFTADRPLKLTGSSTTGSLATGVDLEVVLENPSYMPATLSLPLLTINTTAAAPVTSTDTYVTGTMTITDAANSSYNYKGTLGIKGHGHSTWLEPKSPIA